MRILWTYASVEATRTIVETGVTTRVDAEHTTPELSEQPTPGSTGTGTGTTTTCV